jgi:hypothetical protein
MTVLERYEQDAVLLKQAAEMPWDGLGDAAKDLRVPKAVRDNLLRSREARLAGMAQPKAAFGPFWQMMDGAIALADQTAVTGTAEAALWPVAQYTGWAANQIRAGQVWYCMAFGVITTPASSQGNITLTPRYGTSSGGVALGASAATALVASATNAIWNLEYLMVSRVVGLSGTNSSVVGNGSFSTTTAAIAASTGNNVDFGSTASVSVDLSIAAGLYMGVTMGSASDSIKTLFVGLSSLN